MKQKIKINENQRFILIFKMLFVKNKIFSLGTCILRLIRYLEKCWQVLKIVFIYFTYIRKSNKFKNNQLNKRKVLYYILVLGESGRSFRTCAQSQL